MVNHTLSLHGRDWGEKPTPEAVGAVLTLVKPTVMHAVRMGFMHSSRMIGRTPKALNSAADIRFIGLGAGPRKSTQLYFESPLFGEAAHDLYAQTQLWEDAPNENESGLDLFGYALNDIASRIMDSSRYDPAYLRIVSRFDQVFKRGVQNIEVTGHNLTNGYTPPVIGPQLIQSAKALISATPTPKRVRVQGDLDMIRISDCMFELVLSNGDRVRAVWVPKAVVALKEYMGKSVLIEGYAVFRPSGSLLRVDAEAISLATKRDVFFSKLPTPDPTRLRVEDVRHRQTIKTGYNAIAGTWPGDETIEDLLETLEEIG
ncbi:hypothetical protein LLG95_07410 [bacterium]|nr:hypothetical protein [bacterium]